MEMGNWITFFLFGWGSSFSAYVVLQSIALATLKKWLWYAAAVAAPFMLYVALITIEGYAQGSNMWPIVMIFGSPLAIVYVLAVTTVGLKTQNHPKRRALTLTMSGTVVAAIIPYVVMFTNAR